MFSLTNGLIALLAAGMAGQAAAVLHGADLLPGWGEQLWDSSALLSDDSLTGRALHTLVGYSARPSGIQLAAWATTLVLLAGFSRLATTSSRLARPAAAVGIIAALLFTVPPARADDPLLLTLRDHRFEPTRLEVPAGQKFKLLVHNADATADEFESTELNREKLVTPGQTITVFLGPLDAGEYKFFGDFHQDTAQGVLVAK
jgi:plastocyanin